MIYTTLKVQLFFMILLIWTCMFLFYLSFNFKLTLQYYQGHFSKFLLWRKEIIPMSVMQLKSLLFLLLKQNMKQTCSWKLLWDLAHLNKWNPKLQSITNPWKVSNLQYFLQWLYLDWGVGCRPFVRWCSAGKEQRGVSGSNPGCEILSTYPTASHLIWTASLDIHLHKWGKM